MQVSISPVYPDKDGFKFEFHTGGRAKGYEFASKKGAIRGRALMIKKLKQDGIKVFC